MHAGDLRAALDAANAELAALRLRPRTRWTERGEELLVDRIEQFATVNPQTRTVAILPILPKGHPHPPQPDAPDA